MVTGFASTLGGPFYLETGDVEYFRLDVTPIDATIQTILWTSSDPGVISVARVARMDRSVLAVTGPDSEVRVTAVGLGSATLTATAQGSGGVEVSATVNITVSLHRPGDTIDVSFGGVTLTMAWIPGGTFTVGGETGWNAGSMPAHEVTLTEGFWMGIHTVTQDQWEALMPWNPSFFNGDSRRPVEQVTWFDAVYFANALSEDLGLDPVYDITVITGGSGSQITNATVTADFSRNGFRLPTNAEWERAARAGTTTHWSFGDNPTDLHYYAWYDVNSGGMTQPVGTRRANAWGLYDTHGNVSEWVWDWFTGYTATPEIDPRGPDAPDSGLSASRVVRGGSWFAQADFTRSAFRFNFNPGHLVDGLQGFRLVRP